jgi:hypothetical protein
LGSIVAILTSLNLLTWCLPYRPDKSTGSYAAGPGVYLFECLSTKFIVFERML